MAFLSTDWTIDYSLKTVTNNDSGTGNNLPVATGDYSKVGPVLEFFQWLAAEFAASAQMDNPYAFVSDTPTVFRWVEGWAFGHADDYKYLDGASIESSDANDFWSNAYTIGSQEVGTQIYLVQNDSEVTPWWITGNIDILVHVKTGGVWIQSDNTSGIATDGGIWLYAREFGESFDHGFADISGGRSPIGINTAPDSGNKSGELFLSATSATGFTVGSFVVGGTSGAVGKIIKFDTNDIYLNAVRGGTFVISETLTEYSDREAQTATGQSTTNDGATAFTNVVAGYTDITDTFGTISRDLNNGNGSVNYDAEIDCAARPMTEVYEWLKYLVRYGSTGATYTVNGDDGQEYRSASEGTYTDVKIAPFGSLAGTTFYGARGIWVTNYASADFVLIDATGTEQAPPNYQKVIVSHADLAGGVSGDGSVTVFVAEISAGNIIKNQYTVSTADGTSITTTLAIDINKVPQSGVLRAGTDTDVRYDYTSFSGSVFSGVTPDPTGLTGDLYVPLLDLEDTDIVAVTTKQSDNIIYSGDIDVRTVVRRYGTKPYTADTAFSGTGLSFSPILTDDPQAT
ncbi:MAG: hypothetical protein U9O94_11435 [Nanoarchaeota archaeon]|nr:hypothetical protein [Nanoarchaeota archaeon]